jgi:broad specificity phosphatase PhoE
VLVLVRHGRTDVNARGLLQGRMDPPLDELGMVQAAEVAKAIERPDRVISSPLLRARQTAEAFGCPVEVDERWIELDYGELDGLPVASVGIDVWKQWRSDLRFAPPGGESIDAMTTRVVAACDELVDEATWRTHLDAASITRIVIGPHGPLLRTFNETAHLGRVPGPVRITG